MHLHEFLAEVHAIVKPRVYLEIGVQYGTSLNLAKVARLAIGVDPRPKCQPCCNQVIFNVESDLYFNAIELGALDMLSDQVDLGFIDGLHHAEQALRDFLNLSEHLSETGTIIIDDVLPRNEGEANRVQCPGDWTGDVWKMGHLLHRDPEVQSMLVSTEPTGVMVVVGATKRTLREMRKNLSRYEAVWSLDAEIEPYILDRTDTWEPESALEELRSIHGTV